jgi:phospholipase/carboxylesterase
MHNSNHIETAGVPLDAAKKVMIMVHGRGASAQSILALSAHFAPEDFAYVAPQASGGTWYPYSFMTPMDHNEPHLSSALEVVGEVVEKLTAQYGFSKRDIYLLGFSQGACLSLEYVARNADQYGGVFGLSGGLIGPEGTPRNYEGSTQNTPVFLGCSDIDHHIPKERVVESAEVFEKMGAVVTLQLYKNFGHSVNSDEIDHINRILMSPSL